jgi:NAD(P)H-hydrate epimerase
VRPVVTVAEMQAVDAAAAASGPGVDALVQRAGTAVAAEALRLLGGAYGRRVVVVAGKGNNGADGRVAAARLAARGALVEVVDAPGRDSGPVGLPRSDLVIDAAYGTGFSGEYHAPDAGGAPVLAVDIPSGVNGDTGAAGPDAVHAVATVTFAALKPGLLLGEGPALAGRVIVADIGLDVTSTGPTSAHLVEDADIEWLPERRRDGHKWDRATWIVAGSPGMRGAARLCSRAAQRAGAGMIHLGSPGVDADQQPPGEAVARTLPAEGWDAGVLAELERFGSVVVGPGLGRASSARDAVRRVVAGSLVPVVVDADGLFALGTAEETAPVVAEAKSSVILTPHAGEFSRLSGGPVGPDRLTAARQLAARTGAVVLLKGSTTVVADPDGTVLLAASGDARLATAGTGDVLSGVIGAFLAAGVAPLPAAALAAHVHGRAARLGPAVGLVAGDVCELLPAALAELARSAG